MRTDVRAHIRKGKHCKSVVRNHRRRVHSKRMMGFYRNKERSRTIEEYPLKDSEGMVSVVRITNDSGNIYKTISRDPELTFVLGMNPGIGGSGRVRVEFEKNLKKKMLGMKQISKVGPHEKRIKPESRII